jgi:hypothetical protein
MRDSKDNRPKVAPDLTAIIRHDSVGNGTLASLFRSMLPDAESWYQQRWGADLQAKSILVRWRKLSLRLSPEYRELYLKTAESIAAAEEAKKASKSGIDRRRFARLAKTALAAAKLAKDLSAMFPPPWKDERAAIGALIEGLSSFVEASLHASFLDHLDKATGRAGDLLRTTRAKVSRKTERGVDWGLLSDLAWLASNKTIDRPDERTVRRYLDSRHEAKNPSEAYWKRADWKLIQNSLRIALGGKRELLEASVKSYLRLPNV